MKIYLVGGAVRDELLNLPVKERDWVIVGATTEDMLASGYQQVGKDFPVFLHPISREEYALARTERKIAQGYTGFTCYASPQVTLEEDLYRRDITINAIARSIEDGKLIDPYHGQIDIRERLLRHVSGSFWEDPLRVLRVARFAASFFHLDFRVAPETMKLMQQMLNELPSISAERVWKETNKALLTSHPQVYFQVLRDCGALKIIFPEIDALFGVLTSSQSSPKIDTGMHTMKTVEIIAQLSNDAMVRFAMLCHDLGKTLTPRYQWPYHYGHGIAGMKLVEALCIRLRVPNDIRNFAKIVAKYHDILHGASQLTPKMLIDIFYDIDVWRHPERIEQIVNIIEANARSYREIKNNIALQGRFLREAYHIACSVNSSELLSEGFIGAEISLKLRERRQKTLAIWKQKSRH